MNLSNTPEECHHTALWNADFIWWKLYCLP